jgi:dimethylargininase
VILALTRAVSPNIGACELTHLERTPIDVARAVAQHDAYERRLREAGYVVRRVSPAPELPDAVFVEDTAVVLDELAVLTRPGAASRRAEVASVAEALRPFRTLCSVEAPGTLDGGDVLRVGRDLFVGVSGRSNVEGIGQLDDIVQAAGYRVRRVAVQGCLHLKSAATAVGPGAVLFDPRHVDPLEFAGLQRIAVDPDESRAANALWLGAVVLYPAAFPRTRRRLERFGIEVLVVDASELARAEGGLTCCSLLLEVGGDAESAAP